MDIALRRVLLLCRHNARVPNMLVSLYIGVSKAGVLQAFHTNLCRFWPPTPKVGSTVMGWGGIISLEMLLGKSYLVY